MSAQVKTDEIIKLILDNIPEDLRKTKEEVGRNVRTALNSAFNRMNLVTREEFEIQSELLSRTRALVDELQQRLDQLEGKDS